MAFLDIKSVTCLDQQERGSDELYLRFNGTKIALGSINQGGSRTLNSAVRFTGTMPLSLFEDDGNHWYDRDDHIQTHRISDSRSPGDFALDFRGDGGHYLLVVGVLSI